MMTRKDYKLIADVLKLNNTDNSVVYAMATALRSTNPRFDYDRFVAASKQEQDDE